MEENIKVYVQTDSNSIITQIDSSIFLFNVEGWTKIDEGQGDKYSHAQGSYLEKGLVDNEGKYNYKLVNGEVVELTNEEKEKLFPKPTPQPTLEQQLLETQALVANLQEQILLNKTGGM